MSDNQVDLDAPPTLSAAHFISPTTHKDITEGISRLCNRITLASIGGLVTIASIVTGTFIFTGHWVAQMSETPAEIVEIRADVKALSLREYQTSIDVATIKGIVSSTQDTSKDSNDALRGYNSFYNRKTSKKHQ